MGMEGTTWRTTQRSTVNTRPCPQLLCAGLAPYVTVLTLSSLDARDHARALLVACRSASGCLSSLLLVALFRRAVQRHFVAAREFAPPFTVQTVGAAFTRAIIGLDADLRQQPEHMSGHDQSGSTLTMVAVTPTDIICANTGDSRSVLSRAGTAIDLSNDHKPFLEEEKTRIERAGGHVKFNRVNGDLAVSRALGDFAYKQVSACTSPADEHARLRPRLVAHQPACPYRACLRDPPPPPATLLAVGCGPLRASFASRSGMTCRPKRRR